MQHLAQYVPSAYMPEPPTNELQQFYNVLKSENRMPQRVVDELCQFMDESLPRLNRMPNSFYQSQFKDNGRSPFKKMYYFHLGPRLRWLYASEVTAQSMRWLAENTLTPGEMSHPTDSIAWKTSTKHIPSLLPNQETSEINDLWVEGISVYDISRKQNFQLRATLIWTISNFPTYSMLSGWSTSGHRACSYWMEDLQAFSLKHGRKTT
ncbi:hypothetical protein SASPL_123495 [Salvia splendens]|uniref:Uncharacterized protein n=1 Tax=Salvia splendens TaxID=180675 RepID=A0A8X8XRA3_SALSN|nr:hypothetical protein SASPL_123495 [Salvia splendens]